ncbi:histidine phosphotransferase family protein [Wenxinia marina]|uniref:Histidine phosphotransferase ChpT C-terminal domain-containing protein n=1 Tax=Wenxinia marina DSM 24838 TaxID=1123501 RepID=A0A0D0Q5H7_9RHOB|nr:histidine phosphotransferase family protein [Wenxinia marina]KIQ67742.1 hypothetical protein Wenmar_03701 [Wenxinia marina DSM 24838]GGL77587.1 histidine phosphotransferase [Wenxinia marina]
MTRRADIVALVGSRICHDLGSPLGAIGNGVELMTLAGDGPPSPEMELIAQSIETANAMLRFFRLAFGRAAPGSMVARDEIAQLLAAASRGGRLTYYWAVDDPQERAEVRAVLLTLMCFESALPRGGDVHIRRRGPRWEMWAEGDRLAVRQDLWSSLSAPAKGPAEPAPAEVQFVLLPEVLAELDRTLAVDIGANRITAGF